MPEKDIKALLRNMTPVLNPGEYVFLCIEEEPLSQLSAHEILMTFQEEEGKTVIITKAEADRLELSYQVVMSHLTMKVYSDLEATGFTAAMSRALTDHDIPCNVVAGFHHDHIFVPVGMKDEAMLALRGLSSNS